DGGRRRHLGLGFHFGRLFRLDVELQFKIDRGVVEAAYRRKGDLQLLRHVREGESNFEAGVAHLQTPILELDDDRHLLRILLAQPAWDAHYGRSGKEGDEEVVVSGTAGARALGQHLAHDAPQRFVSQYVVAYKVLGHAASAFSLNHQPSCNQAWRWRKPNIESSPALARAIFQLP